MGEHSLFMLYNDITITLAIMNIGLGVFNLLPVPPLDGSKILNAVLPARIYFKIMQYERYGFIILILLLNMPIVSNILDYLQFMIYRGFISVLHF
jgi:Zn-dependent protease